MATTEEIEQELLEAIKKLRPGRLSMGQRGDESDAITLIRAQAIQALAEAYAALALAGRYKRNPALSRTTSTAQTLD